MKIKYFLTLPLFALLLNCSTDEENSSESPWTSTDTAQTESTRSGASYPNDQMVIRFRKDLPEVKKEIIRQKYNVQTVQNCNCAQDNIELWFVNEGPGPGGTYSTIEEKVVGSKDDSGVEGSDFNNYLSQSDINSTGDLSNGQLDAAFSKISPRNSGITIAVIDTGIDYNYHGFPKHFLYNSNLGKVNCTNKTSIDYFGWDFVNNDNNPADDNGHGTVVTQFITSKLTDQNINYQILPLKAFNKSGRGTYFNILCAYIYAYQNPDVKLVNLSFGWDEVTFDILTGYIQLSKDKMLVVSSAGNSGHSTDNIPHYPSNVESHNMLSIASTFKNTESSNMELSNFSNFGRRTVDIAANGENLPFYWSSTANNTPVSGTSFSCPKITALAGSLYTQGTSILDWRNNVIGATTYSENLHQIKYSSFLEE